MSTHNMFLKRNKKNKMQILTLMWSYGTVHVIHFREKMQNIHTHTHTHTHTHILILFEAVELDMQGICECGAGVYELVLLCIGLDGLHCMNI